MKNRHALNFVLAATLLSMTVLTVNIPFVRAIEWSSETQLTTHSSQDMSPSIMQAGDGTIWVVWVSNRKGYPMPDDELFYKTSSDYGSNWSLDTRLTEAPGYDSSPSIMQASNGTIWVVWSSYRTGNYELFYKTFNGSSWSPDEPLTNETNRDVGPSIMQASNGTIWVVWQSDRPAGVQYELYYKIYNGSAWSTEMQLPCDSSDNKDPSIMQASNGTIWVVWSSYRTGNYELFYKTFNGTVWSSDTQLTDNTDCYHMDPSIAQARDGTIWVVWQSDELHLQDDLWFKVYDGSNWSSDTQITTDPTDDVASSIAQIDDRKIWVVWAAQREDENFDIYYITSNEIIIHDVAVTNVNPSAIRANVGENVSISVVIENQGDMNETFDVSCYANTITVGSTTITLANGTSTTLVFSWNTTGVDLGNYTISAEASVVSGEIDTSDNTNIYDMVMVTIPGDVNGDGTVNITDLTLIGDVYGTLEGDADYNPYANLNYDEVIDIYDLMECGKNYGNTGFP